MKEIIPFQYDSQDIRIVTDEAGDPWWIASDVCAVLDLCNPTEAVRGLEDDEKSTLRISEGGPERNIINEPGLYSLIIRSNKAEAKKFKRWITHEVLPTIRKTGQYAIGNVTELDLIIKSAQAMKRLESRQIEHDQRLKALEAKQHQNAGETGYWTISAWCRLNNLTLSMEDAKRKGRVASKLSAKWGVPISKVADERFGSVNSYREDVLEEVFDPIEEMVA